MTKPPVAIVDYGMGNLFSVERACQAAGLAPLITADPEMVAQSPAMIVPGVGGMPDAMQSMRDSGLGEAVAEGIRAGRPMLGICLGMQMLMARGTEFEPHTGLGLIGGEVRRFPDVDEQGGRLLVPHIGWTQVDAEPSTTGGPWLQPFLDSVGGRFPAYFVHSYDVVPEDPSVLRATASYGGRRFCAIFQRDNIVACQFHPERSGPTGLLMLEAFRDFVSCS